MDFDRRKYQIPEVRPNEEIGAGSRTKTKRTNYITIPSNPIQLIDMLTLLLGSKDAGNTGVRNEIVSICDELHRQKVMRKSEYKKLLNNI